MLMGSHLASQSFTMLGAASDSFFEVIVTAGVAAFMVFVFGLVMEGKNESPRPGIFKRKPLLAPALGFVVAALLVVTLVPVPMSQYLGNNDTQFYLAEENTVGFKVYGSEFYQKDIVVGAAYNLRRYETLTIKAEFYINGALTKSASLNLTGFSDQGSDIQGEVSVPLEPGQYQITLRRTFYYDETPRSPSAQTHCTLEQPLVPGVFNEVLAWSSYVFILEAGCTFLLIAGICIGKEERDRYSREKTDQEPPKDGSAYAGIPI
jgi:hypothetical protein